MRSALQVHGDFLCNFAVEGAAFIQVFRYALNDFRPNVIRFGIPDARQKLSIVPGCSIVNDKLNNIAFVLIYLILASMLSIS